ncbi:MAG: aminotransferase class V-fold PLP-dependent enzyme [Candidatus Omnitrophica bacterium]|nr:aminotransferase class V-fold PLP-dependent enzyme [Candidatus Omnitrophota bacterium]
MSKQIQLDAPSIGLLEKKYVLRALQEGFVSTYGPYVAEFERKFVGFIQGGYPVAVQSGTAALHLALYKLGIGPQDEVIVPALTFIASVNPVMYVGAKPVFVDVDALTWNISVEAIEKKITDKTKAIIVVHLYGNCCDMDRLTKLAHKYKLFLIEDATESLGSRFAGQHTGTFGDYGCFSFNGNKTVTTGGGGLILCRSSKVADHARHLVNQARPGTAYTHNEIGFNYRMTNLEASLGLAQLERLKGFVDKKRKFREIYEKETKGLPVRLQQEYEKAQSCFWLNAMTFENETVRAKIEKALIRAGIPFRRLFVPLPESTPYSSAEKKSLINTYDLYHRGLCLPSSVVNTEKNIQTVCRAIRKVLIEK